jgi:HPt (histidine-containing phosphotransfer) domain-containing protein
MISPSALTKDSSMSATASTEALYYSVLGDDRDLADIVALFVEEMPLRVRHLKAHFGCANWDELARLAHQLKGAAGSYGFDQITPFAAKLEKTVRDGEPQASIREALEGLVEACGRVRAGAPA